MLKIPSTLCGGEASPLGMESGEISDSQISASTSYNMQSVGPQNARLNREISGGAWCPNKQLTAANSGTEWIQVDLAGFYVITAVATQGRFGNGMGVEFTEEFWIEYSRDNGTTWNKWTDKSGDYKLPGNHDTYTPHKNILSHPLVGINLIRIVPFAKHQRTTCIRFELYGCRHDFTLPVSYDMPDGVRESSLGDMRDLTYDGRHDFYGLLKGGLGQLTDGIKGDDNYKVNYGYEWIGWRIEPTNPELSLIFKFDTFVNFSSAIFHCHNLYSKDVQVFAGAKVWFSFDGDNWSKRPLEFEYMSDTLEHSRDVVIHLHHRIGMFVKFDLQYANKWIMISEVTFNTSPVDDNFTITYEHLESPFNLLPFSTSIDGERAMFPQMTFLIVFGVLSVVLFSVMLFLLRMHLRRKEKAGHIVVCMKDLATTPLYCEPKDFSSTSSTISNTVSDPEYAVPDVAMSNVHLANGTGINGINGNVGGHLNSNLNMFGAGFTRIFMGGQLKANNNKTTAPIPVSATLGSHGLVKSATLAPANMSTSNVAYSTQKFPYLTETSLKNSSINVTNYGPNMVTNTNNGNNIVNGRQYYASTDLIVKSAKMNGTGNIGHSNPALEQVSNGNGMTSNTIYNKRKFAGVNEDVMTNGSTLKLKYSTNGMGGNEPIDEMKCIPEVSEADIEVIRTQWGHSRYGEILLGRFRDQPQTTNSKMGANLRTKTTRTQIGNDVSSETETTPENGNDEDKVKAQNSGTSNETLVILKTLDNEKLRNEFVHEMKSKWFISAKSERVAKLIGYLSTPRHMAMVLECGNCDLSHFLPNCDKKLIGIDALMHIGSEVAAGMKYLESLGYVHRDLSARNCIIYTSTLQVKITDVAAIVANNGHEYCNGVALRWVAPEALINGTYTTKSDVYSFGVTLWEILTYCLVRPHHELDDQAFLQKILSAYESYMNDISNECSSSSIYYQAMYATTSSNGAISSNGPDGQTSDEYNDGSKQSTGTSRLSYRMALPRPTTCPAEIYDLMFECWQLNEHTRPSFRDITQFMTTRNNVAMEQVYA
ncbi:hypothetical protein RDWZM_000974 [Blomia tropicalis]|uniref:Discoidin domain-containing receptor 2 n=1 Tax=Blomia tropicalis TaxID=40697 RepID=A0A9Q0RQ41_BLOTA|nr:hypothetical protein RDWZM_000974 [Blomia tropicalis]